ncbi:hypothetical protein GP486_001552 [Trichoglossum hirsutum]|uniref:NACHT domain-containing protein n=1 Tax=Trichoglossum hirsutum TaxID=265104 RepID=A0A9P8LGG5_9PEZI|nr:hypothetical protein GP486_001552 [Trichoglossum hirsutum]
MAANYEAILASWTAAVDLLASRYPKGGKAAFLKAHRRASFEELLNTATAAKKNVELKRYRCTERVQNILRCINHYAVAGDVSFQQYSEYTSLAWGSIRFLVKFFIEEGTISEKLSDSLESVVHIIFRAEEYAKLFTTHSGSSSERVFLALQGKLTNLYAEVLDFLAQATEYFEKPTWRRYISAGLTAGVTKLKSSPELIDKLEREVEKDLYDQKLTSAAELLREEIQNGVWLKHADFAIELQNLHTRRVPGTCEWFLEHKKYLTWRQSEPTSSDSFDHLWVYGKPGSGKSTLAAQVVLDVRRLPGSTVLFVSCKDGQENKSDLQSILQNLVFQLLEHKTHSKRFHQIVQSARLNTKTQYVQSIGELWNLLQRMLPIVNMAYFVLDGLDECNSQTDELISFVTRLKELFSGVGNRSVKLMVISRLDKSLLGNALHNWLCIDIQTSDVRGDIEEVFRYSVQKSRVLRHHKDLPSVQEKLINDSEGMFLWIDLMIKELEAGHWDIGSVVQKAPEGLGGIFEAILKRIVLKATSVVNICNAISLVLAAGRPLRIGELAIGVALLGGLRNHEDYDARGDPHLEGQMIIRETSPLIMVMPDKTVQLVHKSFKDFLLGEEIRNAASRMTGLSRFCFQLRKIQKTLALALVKYLSFECFRSELSSKGLIQLHSKFLLLDYSSHWLLHHAMESEDEGEVADRLVTFFRSPQGWRWLHRLYEQYGMSYGHLQPLQSRVKSWALLAGTNDEQQEVLCSFLTFLSKRRLMDTISTGAEVVSILQAMDSLTTVYESQGQWAEAESIALEAVETSRRMLGEEDSLALKSMANLASTYVNQGRLADAERLHVQTMDIRKRVLGKEHPDTLASMAGLASTFWSQGRWAEAETLHMSVLEARKRVLGEEHEHTLLSIANLATTYLSQGRWDDAEKLGLQVMMARKRLLGEEHPHTLASMANLASAYWRQGRWRDAETLNLELVGKCQTILGAEHPHTLISMCNLATTLKDQGRLDEAEGLETQVFEARKKTLGADHPHTLTSMGNLASTFWSLGRSEEAERLDLQVIERKLVVLGPKHPETLVSISNLAHSYRSIGRLEEASELEAKVLAAEGGA